ncbi:MAG: YwiC-like family protein [Symploca sp. SIO2G7]|nr:YwiC-like family protein [Symploca sp. SIO2G7]
MALSRSDFVPESVTSSPTPVARGRVWYRPTLSSNHGVYVVLLVSFLTGAAAAGHWTLSTTLALVCAFAGFQAEHPITRQIRQRRRWKPRFLFWGSIYAGISLVAGGYLYLQTPMLLWIYLGAIAALAIDGISVLYRQQRNYANELLTFTAVCLSAPLAYLATTGTLTISVMGLWLLNTLFFSSAIFTVKLRKPKTASLIPPVVYHIVAAAIVTGLCLLGWLTPIAALSFGIALLKLGFILLRKDWYRTTRIYNVAKLETLCGLSFMGIVMMSQFFSM